MGGWGSKERDLGSRSKPEEPRTTAGGERGGGGFGGGVGGVAGGELEAVEDGGGATGVDTVPRNGGDDEGDGDLDGLTVLEQGQVELGVGGRRRRERKCLRDGVAGGIVDDLVGDLGGRGEGERAMAGAELPVEVAKGVAGEGG